jgi:N-acetyllactosaminide beta-1,3-N-acetylglucosaminyltransferase
MPPPNPASVQSSVGLPDIALATQCSVRNLHHLSELALRWQGAISVAVFAETRELGAALWGIAKLRSCHIAIRHNVSFQLVTPLGAAGDRTPILPPSDATASCESRNQDEASPIPNYAQTKAPYPVNLLRNVARRAVQAEFVLLLDADMLPSARLRERFFRFATRTRLFRDSQRDDKTVYVIPAFEARQDAVVPRDKAELLGLSESGQLRPFYFELCLKCQVNYY